MSFDFTKYATQLEYMKTRNDLKLGIVPTIVITSDDGVKRVVSVPYSNEDEKQHCILVLRCLLQNLRAKEYMFVTRIQMGSATGYNQLQLGDIQEGVMFMTKTRLDMNTTLWTMVKGEDDEVLPTDPQEIETGTGSFDDLLDASPFNHLSFTKKRKLEKSAASLMKLMKPIKSL